MHVFIDTNILLNFYHFSKDELDALNNVFASHTHGAATVHLTRQVQDEFKRNREEKIKDALKRFRDVKFSAQLPSFMKGYEEYDHIQKLCAELQALSKAISAKVEADIVAKKLLADALILDIFARSKTIETTPPIFESASMRVAIGNPPGKRGSIGDAINWAILLEQVPDTEPLHIISQDGDFFSSLNEDAAHPFLEEEWKVKKSSELYVYRALATFMSKHFDGVAFPFDKEKDALIEDLGSAGSFSTTHGLIAKLERFPYFSHPEVDRILNAAAQNDQFGRIVADTDVSNFLNRVAVPRLASISTPEHREILTRVIEANRLAAALGE